MGRIEITMRRNMSLLLSKLKSINSTWDGFSCCDLSPLFHANISCKIPGNGININIFFTRVQTLFEQTMGMSRTILFKYGSIFIKTRNKFLHHDI